MTTAHEVYDHAVRARIAPFLRGLGFRGSGARYALPSDTVWAQLGLQRSRGNSADEVAFTVNVSVIGRAEWERACAQSPRLLAGRPGRPGPARPSPNVHHAVGETVRIGSLMPGGRDVWWSFRSGPEPAGELAEPVVAEVCAAIGDHALPHLLRFVPRAPGTAGRAHRT
ncbi:MAG TPA: DUF4304 domain-containing protein [Streptomyces sp.]|uniref:DUF4304 domain-containing protein n=1 Tax=Streptomyces sp. TaxID=1931 RepID=UPI002D2DB6EC|nr:DUF4304 domain-containing protein [Streptomyces sp.]HZG03318.1 DUF4304 domain-containing protein [Streptomyces sp.]